MFVGSDQKQVESANIRFKLQIHVNKHTGIVTIHQRWIPSSAVVEGWVVYQTERAVSVKNSSLQALTSDLCLEPSLRSEISGDKEN